MGVMPCRRNGCMNILCDRLSSTYGYICNNCFDELVESKMHPKEFMDTTKESTINYDEYMLENEFRIT